MKFSNKCQFPFYWRRNFEVTIVNLTVLHNMMNREQCTKKTLNFHRSGKFTDNNNFVHIVQNVIHTLPSAMAWSRGNPVRSHGLNLLSA